MILIPEKAECYQLRKLIKIMAGIAKITCIKGVLEYEGNTFHIELLSVQLHQEYRNIVNIVNDC